MKMTENKLIKFSKDTRRPLIGYMGGSAADHGLATDVFKYGSKL
jgi:hypothetical protein